MPGKIPAFATELRTFVGAVLAFAAQATDAGPAAGQLAPNDFQPVWHQVHFGFGIGASGLVFVDWNGSGQPSLIAGGGPPAFAPSNSYWYEILRADSELVTGFATTEYLDTVSALLAVDRDGDGDQELLVAHGQTIELWDGEGGAISILASATTTAFQIRSLEYADVDSDGRAEFVFCSGNDLTVVDSISGMTDHQRLGGGCRTLAVGNVDGDPRLEIVVSYNNGTGQVIDGGSGFTSQWSHPAGFGSIVRIGDIDGDGANEIVAGYDSDGLRVFDASSQTEQLTIPTSQGINALRLFDTTGDGRPEIVFGGDGPGGDLHVLDGISGGQIGLVDNPGYGVTDVAWGDIDHDGNAELMWSAGRPGTGTNALYAWDLVGSSFEAISHEHYGPPYGFDAGDVDADDDPEIAHTVLTKQDVGTGGSVFLRDAASRSTLTVHDSGTFSGSSSNFDCLRVALAQLDGDEALEIVETRDSLVGVFDGISFAPQWMLFAGNTTGFDLMGLGVGDLEQDGNLEVVVSTRGKATGVDNFLFVYDGATGALEWQSPSLGSNLLNFAYLRLANVDSDPALEIVVGKDGGELQIWDGVSHVRQLLTANLAVTALDTADIDGDGAAEIYIGTSAGALQLVNPATGALTTYATYAGGAIQGLEVLDIESDGFGDQIFTIGGKLSVRDGASGALVWQTVRLGSNTAQWDSLRAGDFNANGDLEIWLGLGPVGQMIFERPHVNTAPAVSIGTPASDSVEITVGDSLAFAASALDFEEGDLSASLAWTSSLAGPIGSGASFSTAALGVGIHTITAAVADSNGAAGQDSLTVYVRTPPVTVTFVSLGAEDGFLLESSETSEVANYLASNQWRIGDGNNDRQYRSLLSFDTSNLPDDAIVRTAKVRVRRSSLINTNPFTTHGDCLVDVKSGFFGPSAQLEIDDFAAPADAVAAAKMGNPQVNLDWSEGLLGTAGRAAVSLKERTQMRLRFELDDNDDIQDDYLNFFGGDHSNADYRPKLVITYQR